MTAEPPPSRPDGSKTVITVLGLVLGLAPALATFVYQSGQGRREDKKLCIEKYMEVVQLAGQVRASGEDGPTADNNARQLDVTRDFVVEICRQAGLSAAAKTLDTQTATAATPPVVTAPTAPIPAASSPKAVAENGLKPRVYIHIGNEKDREAAKTLQALLNAKGYVAPGVEFIADSPVSSSLRCFKKADCDNAPALAGLVNGLVSQPQVGVADFSKRYEGSTTIRPGHYELWFSPSAELRLKPIS